jgi:hypothetical protein
MYYIFQRHKEDKSSTNGIEGMKHYNQWNKGGEKL